MSIQWTLIAGFLYTEIVVVLLLLLPFISAKRWNSIIKSRFLQAIEGQSFFYFCVFMVILGLCFLDAIREMAKYGYTEDAEGHVSRDHLDAELQKHMKLFRAQRNFFISGFALFLFLVLRRLVTLISKQASLEASNEAAMRQAVSASNAAQKLMEGKNLSSADGDKAVTELKKLLSAAEKERDSALKKAEALQSQSESTSREYDRLMAEHEKLQKRAGEAGGATKKDD
ncbi:B-cell receptor-associated protein 31-like [Amphibalanus amphitrite]|uniref:B-cell receptor-associated protein 31-like n=1 Tax=Amphibalanus amphitrite TaxID=1232801 RepID=UPI001C90AB8C|nr:B-cell receptor-associated protein 31-like [Amphibalanus amphitrite]XP_043198713.1 B-cell receptor-associated protein 31-like [Amphibalanus amphitrite]XP_043198715.1 B-cell receptor-associated protein 31-like [Amphibalanus amphitrite]XP_043198716.1 B-cell receptor-associated protein 31-like [Amphibalanus amphitrite]XP_043198717.1 B-cell receptor-associated protein 31-like [Amphibalanus amphitrite]XP_043198718.1 B-cell receptor-associated protein 31-like [Amphibalanus amphitrite]XP_04319871